MSDDSHSKMRVLFLPKYPVEGASSRYRVHQFVEPLRALGIESDTVPFYSSAQFAKMNSAPGTLALAGIFGRSLLRRLSWALRAKRYDVVYFQREALPLGPLLIERAMRLLGVKTIFDFDDALFVLRKNETNPVVNLFKDPSRVPKIMGLVDAVCASNAFLAESAAQYCDAVYNLPGAEDMARYQVAPLGRDDSFFTVGWIGSPSTEHYLDVMKPALQRVAAEVPHFRFVVLGGKKFACDGVRVEHWPWGLETELPNVRAFDIGVMPLPDDDWCQGKSGGKGRVYMAAGVVPLVSGMGYNLELMQDDKTGCFVPPGGDWAEAILALYADPEKRARIATAAQERVRMTLSIDAVAPRMAEMIRTVAKG